MVAFCPLLFFISKHFPKFLSEILSECLTVLIEIRSDVLGPNRLPNFQQTTISDKRLICF